ncbi:MAG: sugar phosphate nucleotidyltransferase [Bacteroidota bacterium]|nr:sugar phosphate nucleotidyltransferase [Candidatus Kapabacteria bacterium]MDW8220422.1 sugar phosphate nucleotidyltransferase [Bacteroidota bacterium]
MLKKAVIMAGGFGTRLRPITMNLPKPMVPMMNVPMMEHIVNLLKKHHITDIVSLLYFQPDKITSYFGTGVNFGISMKYMQAMADYGTAGAVRYAYEHLTERFIVISGDVLTDFDLGAAAEFHEAKGAKATIVLTQAANPLAFGIVMTDKEGRITRFLEKPSWGEVFSDTINTGIYILEPDVLELIPYQKDFDFSKDLFPLMLQRGLPLYGYTAQGYWQDVGNLDQYQQAQADAIAGKVKVEIKGEKRGTHYIAASANIHETAKLHGTVVIGENVTVGPRAEIINSSIGNGCRIGYGAKIDSSVIWERTTIGDYASLDHDVITNDVVVGDYVTIGENVFISDGCHIGDHAKLASNIKLWPQKEVESRAILTRSLVQEEKWMRDLFTDARVTGASNIEMNPEFGAKFGAALGNSLGADKTVIGSRDANEVCRMVKRAMAAGLMSVGINVIDLQTMPLPLTRQALREGKAVAGFHVRQSPYYPKQIDIILLNADGRDMQTNALKKIERLFFGEDIKRVDPDNIGSLIFPERTAEAYMNAYTSALDVKSIAARQFSIVVDYAYGMTSAIFPRLLGELQCQVVGLNGYIDSRRAIRGEQQSKAAREYMSQVMSSLKYEIGFIIDPGVEKISVVDGSGRWYDERLLAIVAKLFMETNKDRTPYKIAVTVAASSEIEDIAKEYSNVSVVRIPNSHSAMMEATRDKDILFLGDTRGRLIFTEFFFASDSMFAIGKILDMLAKTGSRISDIENNLPRRYQVNCQTPCPWEKKGLIMRRSMEYSEGKQRELIDGVKIFDNDVSILFLPDKERGIFHVTAEATDKSKAQQAAEYHIKLVEQWRDE